MGGEGGGEGVREGVSERGREEGRMAGKRGMLADGNGGVGAGLYIFQERKLICT